MNQYIEDEIKQAAKFTPIGESFVEWLLEVLRERHKTHCTCANPAPVAEINGTHYCDHCGLNLT